MGDLTVAVRSLHPSLDVKVSGAIEGDRIAIEQIGHHNKVAVRSKLVGDKLCVNEAVAHDVGDAAAAVSFISIPAGKESWRTLRYPSQYFCFRGT